MATPNPKPVLTAEDIAEAYFLHPSDHPGLLIVSSIFDGTGFGSWKRAVTIALSTKSKLYFIDGNLVKPPSNSPNLKKCVKCNDMVMSRISNVLSKNIADSIIYTKSARRMWVELEERFGQVNGAKLYQVQKEMCNVSQGVSDISTYFTKVKSLWDELDDLDEIPSCSCSSAEKILKREQNQKLLQFLMGLNDDYNAIRGNILMMSPLPSISQVYSMLIQEEKQREIRSASHFLTESASLAVEASKPSQFYKGRMDKGDSRADHFHGGVARNEAKKSNLFCNYCKKPGHSIDKCYRLHGFPPNFKFKGGRRVAALVQTEDQEKSWPSSILQNSQTAMVVPGLTPEQSSQSLLYSRMFSCRKQLKDLNITLNLQHSQVL